VIGTLKLSKALAEASLAQKQAEAIAEAIADVASDGELVTKSFLHAELADVRVEIQKVKTEMIFWVIGAVLLSDLAMAVGLWLHK
jgi:hypothetical protein